MVGTVRRRSTYTRLPWPTGRCPEPASRRLAPRSAAWPDGGDRGGRIVTAGPPDQVARAEGSATAPYLARVMP
ncbi:hypothetical protein HCJ76_41355 [Streptomyces sp. MC1]|uniref:hypothetical protein n=1 Tax=Streptomyces sp. MC1 TaxID=295105 RepID=UPI0018CA0516|nr:hypothetical protein [Streptomyces sp. MC1]MBG7704367.1 hypothetical protein [Streptomyces sp. MC1]